MWGDLLAQRFYHRRSFAACLNLQPQETYRNQRNLKLEVLISSLIVAERDMGTIGALG
jgi:hypothetical protein